MKESIASSFVDSDAPLPSQNRTDVSPSGMSRWVGDDFSVRGSLISSSASPAVVSAAENDSEFISSVLTATPRLQPA